MQLHVRQNDEGRPEPLPPHRLRLLRRGHGRRELFGADLTGSRFRGVDLSTVRLDGANLERVDFSLASLREHSFRGRKLVGVNLTEADLDGCDFSDVIFEGCHLAGAYISERTRFDRADLRGSYISGANLVKASLRGALMLPSQVNAMVFDGFGIVVIMDDPDP